MGGKTSTSTTNTSPPPQFLEAYQNLINQANPVAQTPYQAYSGPLVAGLAPGQTQAINQAQNTTGIATPYYGQASQLAQQSATPLSTTPFSAQAVQQYQSPYTQQVIDSTLANINQQNAGQQNQLTGSAIASGVNPFGGDRAGLASAELARNQDLASNQTIAGLENQGYTQALGQFNTQNTLGLQTGAQNAATAANAAGLESSIGQGLQASNTADINNLATTGGLAQQQQQNVDTSNYQQFQNQLQYPYQQLSWLAGITEGAGAGAGGTSSTTTPAPFFSLSDSRMKDDKEIVGKMKDGTPIYRFRYSGSPETQLGLMAQDVEKRNPDAVARSPEGVKFVDYKAATDKSANYSAGGIARMAGGGVTMGGLGGLPGFNANSYLQAPYSLGMNAQPGGGLGAQNLPVVQNAIPQPQQQAAHGMGPPQAPKANAPTPFDPLKAIQQAKGVQDAYSTVKGWMPKSGPSDPTSLDQLALNNSQGLGTSVGSTGAPLDITPTGLAAAPDAAASGVADAAASTLPAAGEAATAAGAEAGADLLPLLLLAKRGGRIPHYDDGGPVYDDGGSLASWLNGLGGNSQPQSAPFDPSMAYAQAAPAQAAPPQATPPSQSGLGSILSGLLGGDSTPAQRPAGGGPAPNSLSTFANSPTAAILHGVLGALSSKSPYALQAIAEGGLKGVDYAQQQGNQQSQLDQHPVIDSSGPTTRVYYPSTKEWIDTGIPTTAATQANRQASMTANQINMAQRNADRQNDLAQRTLNLPVKMGTDALGHDVYGIPNPKGGVTPIDQNTGLPIKPGPQSQNSGETLTGEPFLASLNNPGLANQVRQVAGGDQDLSKVAGFKDKAVLSRIVSQYDPSFNTFTAPARAAAVKEFTSGGANSPASQITAGTTALIHFDRLLDAVQRLKQTPGGMPGTQTVADAGIPWISQGAAALRNSSISGTGTPAATALADASAMRELATDEIKKFYSGSQAGETEKKRAIDNINFSKSLPELQSAIQTEANAMYDKVGQLQSRFQTAMGPMRWGRAMNSDIPPVKVDGKNMDFPIVQKNAQAALDHIMGNQPAPQANDPLSDARAAIAKGLPRAEAIKRLQGAGIDASGL